MPRLTWSRAALQDIQRIRGFLADQNKSASKRAIKAIRDDTNILSRQPGLGRPVEGMSMQYREWSIKFGHRGYLIRYYHDGKVTLILAVRHQRESRF